MNNASGQRLGARAPSSTRRRPAPGACRPAPTTRPTRRRSARSSPRAAAPRAAQAPLGAAEPEARLRRPRSPAPSPTRWRHSRPASPSSTPAPGAHRRDRPAPERQRQPRGRHRRSSPTAAAADRRHRPAARRRRGAREPGSASSPPAPASSPSGLSAGTGPAGQLADRPRDAWSAASPSSAATLPSTKDLEQLQQPVARPVRLRLLRARGDRRRVRAGRSQPGVVRGQPRRAAAPPARSRSCPEARRDHAGHPGPRRGPRQRRSSASPRTTHTRGRGRRTRPAQLGRLPQSSRPSGSCR